MSKDNSINIDNSTLGNLINDSFNTTIYNYNNQRINLKERDDGKEYEYVMYCVGQNKKAKKSLNDCLIVTCINIHSYYDFITDHAHLDLPLNIYNDDIFKHNIIKFKGVVQKYTRANGTEDYTIKISNILDMSNRINSIHNNALKLPNNTFTEEALIKGKTLIDKITTEELYEFVIRQLDLIDISICSQDNTLYPGFITNLILSQYLLTSKLDLMSKQDLCIRDLSREAIIELALILSFILVEINKEECNLYLWKHLFIKLSVICNVLQGINKDLTLSNKKNRDEYKNIYENITYFAGKINTLDVKKMIDKIRNRHKDFGFLYPENEEEFKDELYTNLVKILYFKGYFNGLI